MMGIKHALLGTVAALSLIAATTVADARGFYVGTFGGPNWSDDVHGDWFDLNSNTGYVIGGVIGTNLDQVPGLRVEGELSYRHNSLSGFTYCDDPISGIDTTTAVMANAWYDIDLGANSVVLLGHKLVPYVGGGAGYAHRTLRIDGESVSNDGFAWQLGAGVNTEIAQNIQLGIGYRRFQGPDFTWDHDGVASGGTDNSVIAQLTINFN